jgi:hypothetical protein
MELKEGKKVYHDKFGVGTIIGFDNDDKIAIIDFSGVQKRIVLFIAKLYEPTEEQLQETSGLLDNINRYIDQNKLYRSLNEEEIEDLQNDLNKKLPLHYISYLTNFPKEIANFTPEFTISNEPLTDSYFRNTVSTIKEVNLYFDAFELDHLLAIGDDGCGNYYAIKYDDDDRKVYLIDHDGYLDKSLNEYVSLTQENFDRLVEVEANSLEEFGQKIIKDSIAFHNSK